MTYRRVDKLLLTVEKIFQQSFPPQKILIIDNDPSGSARSVLKTHSGYPIAYCLVGYNSGPAGAARIGLQTLVGEGFEWIAWMDDDDPPFFDDTFKVLLETARSIPSVGCIGSVGQRFISSRGLIERVRDEELDGEGIIHVDNVAGNMSKIINADVIRSGNVLPCADLFFGFEELDFDLRMKAAGFSVICNKEHYKKHRIYHNRIGYKIKRTKKNKRELLRDYYSTRNILFILKKNHALSGMILVFIRSFLKTIAGFRHGLSYGLSNARVLTIALFHFIIHRKGAFIPLTEK